MQTATFPKDFPTVSSYAFVVFPQQADLIIANIGNGTPFPTSNLCFVRLTEFTTLQKTFAPNTKLGTGHPSLNRDSPLLWYNFQFVVEETQRNHHSHPWQELLHFAPQTVDALDT
ncbi:uncharacterized protein ARMOST_22318 [Armillaria ostoyae]|uniref:Uncharacterized protein n=1 Tax=Armillaria ostoyae TaxID=47428 RepID=A0A284SCK4_ARMOS|nr:uncharacterized protein ARMOST_22318 [Armillaria ostoyae]